MTRLRVAIGLLTLAAGLGSAHAEDPEPAATHRLTIRARTSYGAPAAHASLRVESVSALSGPRRSLEQKIHERLRNSSWLAVDADVPVALDARGEATLDVRGSCILRVGVATATQSECVKVAVGPHGVDLLELDLRRDAIVALRFDEPYAALSSCEFRLGDDPADRSAVADADGWVRFRGLEPGAIVRPGLAHEFAVDLDRGTYRRVKPRRIIAGERGTEVRSTASIVEEPLATLTGSVVDDVGSELAATVEWIVTDRDEVEVVHAVFTETGAFSIAAIPGAILRLRSPRHADAIEFTDRHSPSVGVVHLSRLALDDTEATGCVRGVVRRDDDGASLAGVTVRSTQIATGAVREYARTDEHGRFHLAPIPAGDLVLEAWVDDAFATQRVHLAGGGDVVVDLRVADSEYVEFIVVDAITRRPIERAYTVVDGVATMTSAFALSRITPTPFEFLAPGYVTLARSLSAADATHHRIVVELQRRSP